MHDVRLGCKGNGVGCKGIGCDGKGQGLRVGVGVSVSVRVIRFRCYDLGVRSKGLHKTKIQ